MKYRNKTFRKSGLFCILMLYTLFLCCLSCGYRYEKNPIGSEMKVPKPAPVQITSVVITVQDITINWNPPTETNFSHVTITWIPGGITPVTVNKGINTYTVSGLDSTKDYIFTLTSVSDSTLSSNPVTVIKPKDAISPSPLQIQSVSSDNTSINITWTPPTDSDFHHVRITWSPAGGSPSQPATIARGTNTFTATGLDASVDYTFTLVSIDDAGNESTPVTETKLRDTTAPDQINVTGKTIGPFSIIINWDDPAIADFSHVRISWSPSGGSPSQPAIVAKGVRSFTATGLDSTVDYVFSLESIDTQGNASSPVQVTKGKDIIPPGQITNVTGTTTTTFTGIKIDWTDPADIDFKYIKISWTPSGGNPSQPATINKGAQTFTANNLDRGIEYTFTLTTVDYAGNESTTPVSVVKSKDSVPPGKVTNVNVSESDTQITITWDDPTDDDYDYAEISWTPAGGLPAQPVKVAKGVRTFTATNLHLAYDYTFSIRTVDTTGNKSAAVDVVKYGDHTAPAPVTMRTMKNGNNLGTLYATFAWFDPTDIDFHHVEITISPVNPYIPDTSLINPGVQSLTVNGLFSNTTYTFTIVAVDRAGNASTPITVTVYTSVYKGSYYIYTAEDLFKVRDDLLSDYIVMDNIDLSGYAPGTLLGGATGWTPIGTNTAQFKGTFDGNGFTISNLTINNSSAQYQGLFGSVSQTLSGNSIKNVTLSECSITGGQYSGCLVGQQSGGTISNCHVAGEINASGNYAGGLIGNAALGPKIENCSAAVDIIGTVTVGGLAGTVIASSGYSAKVTNCFATGKVTGTYYIGGLIGLISGGASNPLNVTDSYATGNVTGTGLTGGLFGGMNTYSSISNCYATGDVTRRTGSTNVNFGGFAGLGPVGSLVSSYYSGTLSAGLTGNTFGTSKTGNDMKLIGTYTGWDFSVIWAIDPVINGGYPYLRNNPPQ
jgi:hypothetical protein